ncbi:BMP family ABC transporter substrate-binding protein [Lactococcus lactis]|uniref:BMP family ABC transporter substrate-binding protein n=1 Tax=Lactococcus lactis TaxID=1358 RepID=UPI00374F5ED1
MFQCAGNAGSGAFNEAKSLNNNRKESDKVWLIGVDQDQKYLGKYTSKDGKKSNFVLVSTIKEVGEVVKDILKSENTKFPSEEFLSMLKNGGVMPRDGIMLLQEYILYKARKLFQENFIIVPEKI